MEPLATHSDCIVTSIRIRYLFLSPMEVLLGVNWNLECEFALQSQKESTTVHVLNSMAKLCKHVDIEKCTALKPQAQIDWEKCCLCQEERAEPLQCPAE